MIDVQKLREEIEEIKQLRDNTYSAVECSARYWRLTFEHREKLAPALDEIEAKNAKIARLRVVLQKVVAMEDDVTYDIGEEQRDIVNMVREALEGE
jgi:hypothetical protein